MCHSLHVDGADQWGLTVRCMWLAGVMAAVLVCLVPLRDLATSDVEHAWIWSCAKTM